jgi:hypothetical protein
MSIAPHLFACTPIELLYNLTRHSLNVKQSVTSRRLVGHHPSRYDDWAKKSIRRRRGFDLTASQALALWPKRQTLAVIDTGRTKFTKQFGSVLENEGVGFREIPPLSPNLNPFAEAWVQRTKYEVLPGPLPSLTPSGHPIYSYVRRAFMACL